MPGDGARRQQVGVACRLPWVPRLVQADEERGGEDIAGAGGINLIDRRSREAADIAVPVDTRPEVPLVLRGGANRAFHEGVGELINIAAGQVPQAFG